MAKLEYQLGEIRIDKGMIHKAQNGGTYGHRFVVQEPIDDCGVKIYVALYRRKKTVEDTFKLEPTELVGAGRLYVDNGKRLVLDGSSRNYGSIPHEAAREFGKLLIPELKISGIDGVDARTDENELNRFWEVSGFKKIGKRKTFYSDKRL